MIPWSELHLSPGNTVPTRAKCPKSPLLPLQQLPWSGLAAPELPPRVLRDEGTAQLPLCPFSSQESGAAPVAMRQTEVSTWHPLTQAQPLPGSPAPGAGSQPTLPGGALHLSLGSWDCLPCPGFCGQGLLQFCSVIKAPELHHPLPCCCRHLCWHPSAPHQQQTPQKPPVC